MSYYWDEYFPWKMSGEPDDNHVAKPIPFTGDYAKNLQETLDWLIRGHTKAPYHRQEEMFVLPVREGWMHNEKTVGRYYHICDGPALLRFRGAYENAYDLRANDKVVELRIAMWGLIGQDGYADGILGEEDENLVWRPVENTKVEKTLKSGLGYRWTCSKCCVDIPKATKAWVKLNSMSASL
jgi:hypothetical protein